MPKETTNFGIPKPLDSDKPPSLENSVGPAFDKVDQLLSEIGAGQVIGGSAGELLIAGSTGAGAYKAMKGDATLAEDGTLTIGAEKVTLTKLAKALSLPESYLAAAVQTKLNDERVPLDGSVTPSKLANRPFVGHVAENGSVVSGEDFTAEKTGTGLYIVELTEEQATPLIVDLTPLSALAALRVTLLETPDKQRFKVVIWNQENKLANAPFHFTAIPA